VDAVGRFRSPRRRKDPLSSWGAQQVEQLSSLGPDPFAWATGDLTLLPAAALP